MPDSTTVDLSTTVGGILLPTCIYNASGPRSGTVEALKKVAQSPGTGAVLSKSATIESQTGNPMPRVHHDEDALASYNSEGLPNQGIDYYVQQENVQEIMSSTSNKPYMASLSGKTLEDNIVMMKRVLVDLSPQARAQISAIELNLACPNIVGKPTLAYDMEQLEMVLQRVTTEFGKYYNKQRQPPVFGVKLPPYLDMIQLQQVADILNQYRCGGGSKKGFLSYITTMNTMGNALPIDVSVQQPFISANSGLAGMSGRAVHATACANVWKFRSCLDPSIDIVGVGGVETGEDVIRLVLCGAKAVQVGTTHWKEGTGCFERIAKEVQVWLEQHGHDSIGKVYNQLQPWSKERAGEARLIKKQKAANTKKSSTAESSAEVQSNDASFWKLVSAILLVIVAVLCADKWHGNLLPSE
mmetsp:Transcript_19231/g.24776  ORF Transcript_19231/g.24776 Transcript_19231/m.24776 type:complete len:413 (+) Transcript_19231:172-1410(+)